MIEYESCKRALACKLVNVRSGMLYLSQVPFAPAFADMAVTACILTNNEKNEEHFLPVTNQLAAEWGIPPARILDIAKRNMFRILTPKVYSMRELMLSGKKGSVYNKVESMMFEEYPETETAALKTVSRRLAEQLCTKYESTHGMSQMWVLSNRDWIYGSSGLIYPRVLEKFAYTHQDSFYIIPSSAHEVILLPRAFVRSESSLKEMLQIANIAAKAKHRYLSDCVYFYDKDKLEIRCL